MGMVIGPLRERAKTVINQVEGFGKTIYAAASGTARIDERRNNLT
jgi:hypothetical protein